MYHPGLDPGVFNMKPNADTPNNYPNTIAPPPYTEQAVVPNLRRFTGAPAATLQQKPKDTFVIQHQPTVKAAFPKRFMTVDFEQATIPLHQPNESRLAYIHQGAGTPLQKQGTNDTVVTKQPAQIPREWSTKLCACCDDTGVCIASTCSCLLFCCCVPVIEYQIADAAGVSCCYTFCFADKLRRMIRKRHNIKGDKVMTSGLYFVVFTALIVKCYER